MPRRAKFEPTPDGDKWRVNIPAIYSESGGRQRKWFTTKLAAQQWIDNLNKVDFRPPEPPAILTRENYKLLSSYREMQSVGSKEVDVDQGSEEEAERHIESVTDRAHETLEDLRILALDGSKNALRSIRDIGLAAARILERAAGENPSQPPPLGALRQVAQESLNWPMEVSAFRDALRQALIVKVEQLNLGGAVFVKVKPAPGGSRSIRPGGGQSALAISIALTLEFERRKVARSPAISNFYKRLLGELTSSKPDSEVSGYPEWMLLATQLPPLTTNTEVQRHWLEAGLSLAKANSADSWGGLEDWRPEISKYLSRGRGATAELRRLLKAGLLQIAHPATEP